MHKRIKHSLMLTLMLALLTNAVFACENGNCHNRQGRHKSPVPLNIQHGTQAN